MSKKKKSKESEVIDFYKSAFCVDGEVKVVREVKGFKIIGVMELNDSKRGKFYVGTLEEV